MSEIFVEAPGIEPGADPSPIASFTAALRQLMRTLELTDDHKAVAMFHDARKRLGWRST